MLSKARAGELFKRSSASAVATSEKTTACQDQARKSCNRDGALLIMHKKPVTRFVPKIP
jgi:hypothetical protein